MDAAAVDKVEALKKKRMGPIGPCSSRFGSQYSMSRTCGPRDIISLVIPRLGDNTLYGYVQQDNQAARVLHVFRTCEGISEQIFAARVNGHVCTGLR
jgi:hypothetical protein